MLLTLHLKFAQLVHDFTNLPHAIHHTSPGETASIGMFLGTGILVFALERKRGFIFGQLAQDIVTVSTLATVRWNETCS
jgi:hypothetical protein